MEDIVKKEMDEYIEFVKKFNHKKTTDDCHTPQPVYDPVLEWVVNEYDIENAEIVRPFWPGGDYENFEYPKNCIVVDNPPFSILSKIVKFYLDNEIKFFLFAPNNTMINQTMSKRVTYIAAGADIVFENGAIVNVGFVTNLGVGDVQIQTAPDLTQKLKKCNENAKNKRKLKKYKWPDNVVSSAKMGTLSSNGVELKIYKNQCLYVDKLDGPDKNGTKIFGCGFLISNMAAAEKRAAEKRAEEEALIKIYLSDREKEIIDNLDKKTAPAQSERKGAIAMSLPHELEELKSLPQWVCYQNQWNERKQKNSKIPKNPATGYGAKANDPATWATYSEAVAAARRFQFDGVGFEFAAGYMGIDLDNVIGADGKINAVAAEIVATIDSYTEYSPSGKGLHILCKCPGAKPIGSRNDAIGLEMYNNGRFFTVTGKPYGAAKPIQERTEQVKAVYMKYLYKPPKEQPKAQPGTGSTPVGSYKDTGTDAELWQKMFSSAKGREIQALYSGDISGHDNDHSRADQALANHLAYWTNNDAARIDRMFRQSGLMRPKWEQKRGAQTYGAKTIAAAIANTPTYTPPVRATA